MGFGQTDFAVVGSAACRRCLTTSVLRFTPGSEVFFEAVGMD
jgi:hypothetical protein